MQIANMPKIALNRAVCQRSQKICACARDHWPGELSNFHSRIRRIFHQSVFAVSPQLVRAGIEAMIEPLPLRQTQSPRASR